MSGEQYEVKLVDRDEVERDEIVFRSKDLSVIEAWLREWMSEPLDQAVVILPPRTKTRAA